jgi:TctA family transporter
VAAQPERTSAAAAATAAILVIFLSNFVVPFDLPTGPAEHFFLSSIQLYWLSS